MMQPVQLPTPASGEVEFDASTQFTLGVMAVGAVQALSLRFTGAVTGAVMVGATEEGVVGAASSSTITVGRWMSKAEYEMMANTGRMVEGAGGQTTMPG
jgi:hypothetical protein